MSAGHAMIQRGPVRTYGWESSSPHSRRQLSVAGLVPLQSSVTMSATARLQLLASSSTNRHGVQRHRGDHVDIIQLNSTTAETLSSITCPVIRAIASNAWLDCG